jgi:Zn-dependent protease with chaperone function/tetratricopeptide (TPR) repeat protein
MLLNTPSRKAERPLNGAEKTSLVFSGLLTIALCYGFSMVAIVGLLLILAGELLLFVGAARFGATAAITPLLKRHSALLSTFFRSFRLSKRTEYRLVLDRKEAPRMFAALSQMAQRFEIAPPREISIEMTANAWVRLEGYSRGGKGTVLAVGYDLLAGLSEDEVQAVLAHEMGHARFVHRGVNRWLNGGLARIALVTSQLAGQVEVFRGTDKTFHLAQALLQPADALTRWAARLVATYSRQDEFEADRTSADLFGSASLRSALIKLELMGEKLARVPWTERVAQLESDEGFSQWLSRELATGEETMEKEVPSRAHDAYSTHPSLRDRLAALPPDDGRRPNAIPALGFLANPDRVAEKLIEEVHRVAAELEQKDSKALARWTKKAGGNFQAHLSQGSGLGIIAASALIPLIFWLAGDSNAAMWSVVALVVGWLLLWKFARYRDGVLLPVPRYAEIWRAWGADRPADVEERSKRYEEELNTLIGALPKKKQKLAALAREGATALSHCDYLKAEAAGRLSINLNNKVADGILIYLVAAAGLGLWEHFDQNIEFIRTKTGLVTPTSRWGIAWTLFLAGDWARAEGLLWRALRDEPNNTTYLAMFAFCQAQRNKHQSAVLNATRAADLEPSETELTKLLARLLIDSGRLIEASTRLRPIEGQANSDPEIAMLVVRLSLLRHQYADANTAAELLRTADSGAQWLIRLASTFESARQDQAAAQFYHDALASGHYPEALLGLGRLATNNGQHDEARSHLMNALNVEKEPGPRARTAIELFLSIVGQLAMIEEPREDCVAWVVKFPKDAVPTALAERSLMVYATTRYAAETHLKLVLKAMQPNTAITPNSRLGWSYAAKDRQPVRPVREGIGAVL